MKKSGNRIKFMHYLLLIAASTAIFACSSMKCSFQKPMIRLGYSKLSGRIILPDSDKKHKPLLLLISINTSISASVNQSDMQYEVMTDSMGNFSVSLRTETNPALCGIIIGDYYSGMLYTMLSQDKETKVNLYCDKKGNMTNVCCTSMNGMTKSDMMNAQSVFDSIAWLHFDNKEWGSEIAGAKEAYLKKVINERSCLFNHNKSLSRKMRNFLIDEFKMNMAVRYGFDFLNSKSTTDYKFEGLKLNSSQLLYHFMLPYFQTSLLQNETLNLPSIGETPVNEWQAMVKSKIADRIGFAGSNYYDLLTAASYTLPMNTSLVPLTERQKKNIHDYFNDNEIEKILLDKNKSTIESASELEPLIVQQTPDTDDDHLVDSIVARHRGRPVIVDFWATWCAPCLKAISDMKEILPQLNKLGVVHVYITSESSPKKLWNEKIKSIGGEHYYIKKSSMDSIKNKYSFAGIPSFLIFDKSGKLIDYFTMYPGNKEILNYFLK